VRKESSALPTWMHMLSSGDYFRQVRFTMLDTLLIAAVIFFSVFTQTASGFGMALIAMPMLTTLVGLPVAAPLVALVGAVVRVGMLLRYHAYFRIADVWRLMLTSVIGIPIGLLLFHRLDNALVESVLGLVVIAYALLALFAPHRQALTGHKWAYSLGLVSGVLSGAYNVGGPPAVIYASGQGWLPITFKGNLQVVTMLSGALVIFARAINREFTAAVLQDFAVSLPAIALGLLAGFVLDGYVNPVVFRKLILILLVAIGAQLLI
jgi:uncharacterized membrane protein YfcA